jgi:NAD(P)-dependent dehydrogenase (short-subunit alcohol dehydrogenase family)
MRPLDGKFALVTGGGKGIGRAIAKRLAAEGARVTVLGRDGAALARTAQEIGGKSLIADVTDASALSAAITAAGPLDILINNAGAALSKPFLDHQESEWHEMLSVNLLSAVTGCRLVLPGMMARGWGRIVNVASTAGLKGYTYTAAYCAAKHAVIGLTRALALELARSQVTVNAVCPGFTDTELVARAVEVIEARTGRSAAQARAALTRFNPQNRLVEPDEVAEAVVFLCRNESAAMTGQSLIIAGGEVM